MLIRLKFNLRSRQSLFKAVWLLIELFNRLQNWVAWSRPLLSRRWLWISLRFDSASHKSILRLGCIKSLIHLFFGILEISQLWWLYLVLSIGIQIWWLNSLLCKRQNFGWVDLFYHVLTLLLIELIPKGKLFVTNMSFFKLVFIIF